MPLESAAAAEGVDVALLLGETVTLGYVPRVGDGLGVTSRATLPETLEPLLSVTVSVK